MTFGPEFMKFGPDVTISYQGRLIGNIRQQWHPVKTIYNINDEHGNTLYQILGPLCRARCIASQRRYSIVNMQGNGIGFIR